MELDKSLSPIPREFINSYSKRWKPLSKTIRTIHLENAYRFSGNYHLDIVPSNIYFSVIEPALNNRSFAVSYEDKARIDWINGSEHVSSILFVISTGFITVLIKGGFQAIKLIYHVY